MTRVTRESLPAPSQQVLSKMIQIWNDGDLALRMGVWNYLTTPALSHPLVCPTEESVLMEFYIGAAFDSLDPRDALSNGYRQLVARMVVWGFDMEGIPCG